MAEVREPIQVYLSSAERERLERLAGRMRVSRSEVLRRGLEALARTESASDAALAELVREGILTPPAKKGGPIPKGLGIMTLEELMADLDEDRADRW